MTFHRNGENPAASYEKCGKKICKPFLIAALLFSGAGALLGAYYGEKIEGKNSKEAWKVGVSSFTGRILGSLFKIICGFIALICISVAMVI